ncbi:hypothetical protein RhiirB3_435306 [Rhizophagus irregularis]|nr:hypothetical protein RhiirB3_435306 [Rhizophagus irregularis]
MEHNLAYICWYRPASTSESRYYFHIDDEDESCNVELWKSEFYDESRDCIIPVHNIFCRFIPSKYRISTWSNAIEYLVTSCTNRKRQIEEEEHEKIKTNYHICIEDLPEIIVENIIKYKENTHPDSSDTFEVSCFIDITEFQDESKVIADNIAEVISETDEYNWIYNTKTENKKGVTYYYLCSQNNELSKKPRKNPDITKQRDRESMDRYNCKGRIKILIDETEHIAYIVIKHHILHNLPPDVSVPETIKQFIKDNVDLFPQIIYSQLVTSGMDINIRQKQIHYWWPVYMIKQYKQHENSFILAQDWLNEFNYSTLFIMDSSVHAIAFLTGFEKLLKEQNIIISECDNTNDQKYELYALIVEVNGTGFPLAYLFLEINGESDKDFAQISAAQMTWPEIKIQLCKWHIQRAVETKLKDYRAITRTNYDEYQANRKFTFIDKQFIPIVSANKKTKIRFCPEEYRPFIWNLMNQHLHLHPLIPNSTGQFLDANQIYEHAVQKMYSYCKENSLVWVWSYMWNEWYREGHWEL